LRGSIVAGLAVAAAALTAGYAAVSGDQDPTSSDLSIGSMFTGTYSASDSSGNCTNTSAPANTYAGYEPTSGTHPLFVWVTGTGGDDQEDVALKAVETAAKRGFVAVSVDFDDVEAMRTETGYLGQAKCMFDKDLSTSAVNNACESARADCSKGIVAMGHSMGGIITTYGANNGGDLNATIAIGQAPCVPHNITCGWGSSLAAQTSTENGGTRQLPDSAYRIMSGEYEIEDNLGFAQENWRRTLNASAGTNCQPDTDPDETVPYQGFLNCLNADGSGLMIVPNGGDMPGGLATHCWFHTSGACSTVASAMWLTNPPTLPYHLRSMIQWLDDKASE
jgi:hypothetical protein